MNYKINEIFISIQGEGFYTGQAVIFIRFSGCNLSCPFCDTKHQTFKLMTFGDIIKEIKKYEQYSHIVLTGGEPGIVPNINQFILKLKERGYYVQVETNGTQKIIADWITCSPKKENDYSYYPFFTNEVKYIVGEKFNIDRIMDSFKYAFDIYLQPESNKKEYIDKCVRIIKEYPECKLSLQIQKLISIQ